MSKHTPGPWEIDPDYMVCRLDEVTVGSNHIQPKGGREYEKADARLIAAAPELLEALDAAVEWDGQDDYSVDAVWLEQAKAALAKAKGEQG